MSDISGTDSDPVGELPAATNETAAALAGYIADLTTELARLAECSELTMLAYFLNLARVEAEFRSRELKGVAVVTSTAPLRPALRSTPRVRSTRRG